MFWVSACRRFEEPCRFPIQLQAVQYCLFLKIRAAQPFETLGTTRSVKSIAPQKPESTAAPI